MRLTQTKLWKKLGLCLVVSISVAAGTAAPATAGTVQGTLTQTSPFLVPTCDYEMTYTGGPPPASLTMDVMSFTGVSVNNPPCDPNQFLFNSDITATFLGGGSSWTATLTAISYTDGVVTGCTFTRSSGTTTVSNTGSSGPYSGGGTAAGTGGFVCSFLSARFDITANF